MSFEVESEDVIRLILQFLKVLWQTQHAIETVLVSKLYVALSQQPAADVLRLLTT